MGASRHHRQTLLPGIGEAGQAALAASHAAIVGVGALGCAAAELLCRAGVGTITIVDRDVVDVTNLQRQVLFSTADVGMAKVEAAAARLRAIDPAVRVIAHAADLTGANAERVLGLDLRARSASEGVTGESSFTREPRNEGSSRWKRHEGGVGTGGTPVPRDGVGKEDTGGTPVPRDGVGGEGTGGMPVPAEAKEVVGRPGVIIDGTDNFETRYLLNDVAVKHGLALVYGGVIATRGMVATFVPGGACLRCVFEEPPEAGSQPTCDTAGVFGPGVAMVGAGQAADAIKILCGQREALGGAVVSFDVWTNEQRRLALPREPSASCPCCGRRRFEFLEMARGDSLSLCGQDAMQVSPGRETVLDLGLVRERLARVAISPPVATRFMVRARVESAAGEVDLSVFGDGRAIVRGTTEAAVARSVYAKYVGA